MEVELAEEAAALRLVASSGLGQELQASEAEVSTAATRQPDVPSMDAELLRVVQMPQSQQHVDPLPIFKREITSCLPQRIADAMIDLESDHMEGYTRIGVPLLELLKRWDLSATWAEKENGELMRFAITHEEGRGTNAKMFVWELHVRAWSRRKGMATSMLELVQMKSSLSS